MLSQLRAGAAALRMSDPDFRQGYPFTVIAHVRAAGPTGVHRGPLGGVGFEKRESG